MNLTKHKHTVLLWAQADAFRGNFLNLCHVRKDCSDDFIGQWIALHFARRCSDSLTGPVLPGTVDFQENARQGPVVDYTQAHPASPALQPMREKSAQMVLDNALSRL